MTIEVTPARPHTPALRAPMRGGGPTLRAVWLGYAPGLVVVVLGALAAGFLANRFGAPLTLMSLLVGLTLNFLAADGRLTAGLALASGSLLRWGIVLVGVRVTFGDIIALGPVALLSVLAIIGLTMGAGVLAARRLGYDTSFGLLAGGAVAICGASAAMALATTLGNKRVGQSQLSLVLVGISAMSDRQWCSIRLRRTFSILAI